VPVTAAGDGLTLSASVVAQPVGSVYVIVAVPVTIPAIIPLLLPAVAIVVLLLLHVPPVVASVSEAVLPVQITAVPIITDGNVSTAIVVHVAHPGALV
jgi:hypothetical protein